MPENTPSPVVENASEIEFHTVHEYGSVVDGVTIKYQVYGVKQGQIIDFKAPVKCSVVLSSGDSVLLRFEENVGMYKTGEYMSVGGFASVESGTTFEKGDRVGTTSSDTIWIAMHPSGSGATVPKDGTVSPRPFVDFSLGNADADGNPISGGSGSGTNDTETPGVAVTDIGSIAKAAAFTTFFSMPGIYDTLESNLLTGQRSLMNDQPLMPFVQQLAGACLRQFMSTPSGDFFAFYPDYFGGLGKNPYWLIEDIEIINGSIELSDDDLATHVFVVGDIVGPPNAVESSGGKLSPDQLNKLNTGGVVTVFNAFMADFLNGVDNSGGENKVDSSKYPTLAKKEDAINFLKKYGARPYYESQPTVRAPIYEAFLAYQKFCLKWAEQFKTRFEFTFMPELFPGGIVAFPEHGLQCYVASVSHNCSYANGFTTSAELMAPSAYKSTDGTPVDPDKSWVHAGMIRSWPTTDAVGVFSNAVDKDPAKEDQQSESGNNGN